MSLHEHCCSCDGYGVLDGLEPCPGHHYFSGFGHMSHPDDPIYPCCDERPDHPIHIPRPAERFCTCSNVLNGSRHYWSPTLGCPQ